MLFKILLFLAGVAGAPSHSAAIEVQEKPCPADAPTYLPYLRQWFATPETVDFRQRFGLTGIASTEIRPLTDAQDAEVCQRMGLAVTLNQTEQHRKLWRGFQAGEFYVMVITTERPCGAFPPADGGSGLIFLDANMRVVAASS